ncbi:uncharacterized protein RHO17_019796 [Thomomys bottae]
MPQVEPWQGTSGRWPGRAAPASLRPPLPPRLDRRPSPHPAPSPRRPHSPPRPEARVRGPGPRPAGAGVPAGAPRISHSPEPSGNRSSADPARTRLGRPAREAGIKQKRKRWLVRAASADPQRRRNDAGSSRPASRDGAPSPPPPRARGVSEPPAAAAAAALFRPPTAQSQTNSRLPPLRLPAPNHRASSSNQSAVKTGKQQPILARR